MEWLSRLDPGALLTAAAAWVHGVDHGVYVVLQALSLILGLVFALMAGATFWLSAPLRRQRPVPMNELTPGYRMVQGRARGPMLESPFTGQPCVWWQIRVWEARVERVLRSNGDRGSDSDGKNESEYKALWHERRHEVSDQPIQCTQGLLSCAVQPAGTTLAVPSEVREWEGPGPQPTNHHPSARRGTVLPRYEREVHNYSISNGELRRENRYRYAEEIIAPGSELFALGQVEPADAAQATGGASAAPWRIGPAFDSSVLHQPYVVSVLPPARVRGTFGQAWRGATVIGGIFLGIGGFLLWARLGSG